MRVSGGLRETCGPDVGREQNPAAVVLHELDGGRLIRCRSRLGIVAQGLTGPCFPDEPHGRLYDGAVASHHGRENGYCGSAYLAAGSYEHS